MSRLWLLPVYLLCYYFIGYFKTCLCLRAAEVMDEVDEDGEMMLDLEVSGCYDYLLCD